MKAIYLDNYRGFRDALIPLTSVNFLVGENSSGKTSFLAALKVMGSPRFWIRPSFDDPDLHFSSFNEIVSKKSNNKRYFTIGLYDDKGKKDLDNIPIFRLLTFKNEGGIPVVSRYSFLTSIGLISTIFSDKNLRYKIEDCSEKSLREMLDFCVSQHKERNPKGYSKFSKEGFPRSVLFSNAFHFITTDLAGKDFLLNKKNLNVEREVDSYQCRWIAPIRAKPEKIYISQNSEYSSEGGHVPYVLNKILGDVKDGSGGRIANAIKEFGANSGLFDAVGIKRFGKDAASPFEVNVNLDGSELPVSNVGYGVSQVLPIILEARRLSRSTYIAIQQPEVHLHPKAQAALGEFIYQSKDSLDNNFVIETHSDYMIDRFRLCTHKKGSKDAQVLYFERDQEGNKVYSISINGDGSYSSDQPSGFRSFFINEELELLRI